MSQVSTVDLGQDLVPLSTSIYFKTEHFPFVIKEKYTITEYSFSRNK
jgi:hypothetical protein